MGRVIQHPTACSLINIFTKQYKLVQANELAVVKRFSTTYVYAHCQRPQKGEMCQSDTVLPDVSQHV